MLATSTGSDLPDKAPDTPPERALFQRQDIACNAHTAHDAHRTRICPASGRGRSVCGMRMVIVFSSPQTVETPSPSSVSLVRLSGSRKRGYVPDGGAARRLCRGPGRVGGGASRATFCSPSGRRADPWCRTDRSSHQAPERPLAPTETKATQPSAGNTSTGPWGTRLPRTSLPHPAGGEGNGKQLRSPCPSGSWCRTLPCSTASARTTGFGRFPCHIRPPRSARN